MYLAHSFRNRQQKCTWHSLYRLHHFLIAIIGVSSSPNRSFPLFQKVDCVAESRQCCKPLAPYSIVSSIQLRNRHVKLKRRYAHCTLSFHLLRTSIELSFKTRPVGFGCCGLVALPLRNDFGKSEFLSSLSFISMGYSWILWLMSRIIAIVTGFALDTIDSGEVGDYRNMTMCKLCNTDDNWYMGVNSSVDIKYFFQDGIFYYKGVK